MLCGYVDGDNNYFLGVSSDGFYAIGKAQGGTNTFFSSPENKWLPSDDIAENAASYRLGADCGNGTLTLYLDGKTIGTASDITFTSGDIGLFTQTFDKANAEIHFEDLIVTALK